MHVHVEAHGTIRHRWDVIQIDDAIALNGIAASSLSSLPLPFDSMRMTTNPALFAARKPCELVNARAIVR